MKSRLVFCLVLLAILVLSATFYACGRAEGEAIGDRVQISGGVAG